MVRTLTGLAFLLAFAASLPGQVCPQPGQLAWQRDTLAPSGTMPQAFSVIQGLCEGEAAAVVFELPPSLPPQRLTQVVAPYGAAGGALGFTATLNLEVYDGVDFVAGLPFMGNQVFDLNASTGTSMQVTSTAFNTLDVSGYNIVVGNNPASRKFAVAFRVNINSQAGSCAAGYTANLFTDNSVPPSPFCIILPPPCNPTITPVQTSLMDIQGQGWRDAALAQVGGLSLCPCYYAGIWAIRACSQDAGPVNPLQVTSLSTLPASSPTTLVLNLNAPGYNGFPYIAAASLSMSPGIPTVYGTIPLAIDPLFAISTDPNLGGAWFINFSGTIGANGMGSALVNVPAGVSGFSFYVAFVAFPPAGNWGISDALSIPIL